MPTPVLLVHGGAWAIPPEMAEDHQRGVAHALATGYAILEKGGTATDAVEAAVTVLEDDPTFDAGRGSFLTSEGRVQLDALLMDGNTLRAGGVACVEHLRNPIQAARLVLDKSPHIYFVGRGAEAFAAQHGMILIDNSELVLDREKIRLQDAQSRLAAGLSDITFSGPLAQDDKSPETPAAAINSVALGSVALGSVALGFSPGDTGRENSGALAPEVPRHPTLAEPRPEGLEGEAVAEPANPYSLIPNPSASHDTVGAVALDAFGNLAAGTSTGGTLNKAPGRVGDSSLIGCGCYADNLSAAVSLTGWGEPIMKLVLGKWATDRVAQGISPELAAQQAIAYLFQRLGGHGGIILLAPNGQFGLAHNTPGMAWGIADAAGQRTGLVVP
jgi:beta-aspartyl-peptidase (threonine type)